MASEPIVTDEMKRVARDAYTTTSGQLRPHLECLYAALTAALAVQVEHPDSGRLREAADIMNRLMNSSKHWDEVKAIEDAQAFIAALGGTNGK